MCYHSRGSLVRLVGTSVRYLGLMEFFEKGEVGRCGMLQVILAWGREGYPSYGVITLQRWDLVESSSYNTTIGQAQTGWGVQWHKGEEIWILPSHGM